MKRDLLICMLYQTLSRLHVCVTLVLAQIIGSICVMVARATAPNAIGPGTVFPNVGTWDFSQGLKGSPMANAPFWIALLSQLIIVLGYFWFYRKEQLCMSTRALFPVMMLADSFVSFFSSPAITHGLVHLPFLPFLSSLILSLSFPGRFASTAHTTRSPYNTSLQDYMVYIYSLLILLGFTWERTCFLVAHCSCTSRCGIKLR